MNEFEKEVAAYMRQLEFHFEVKNIPGLEAN